MLGDVLWSPTAEHLTDSQMARYVAWLEPRIGRSFVDYESLWEWSTSEIETFWSTLWEYFSLGGPVAATEVLDRHSMPGARWFKGKELNYAQRILSRRHSQPAVVSVSETRARTEISYAELAELVGRTAGGLEQLGVVAGDRVVGYLPNTTEAVVAFLACASLGAIWSSCPPEFGPKAVLDRFAQLDPKVLITVDGYRYAGRDIDLAPNVEIIGDGLPTLSTTVLLGYLHADAATPNGMVSWTELASSVPINSPLQVEFSHPLWVLFSSGTTGLPKAIVHSHGGILLEHLKDLGLHCDIGEHDRFFWFSTTGWMMWNFVVSGLLVGATIVLYDGSPTTPDLNRLWQLAEAEQITWFGTSAPFIAACRRAGIEPASTVDLSALRFIGSTASPLSPDGFRWIYEHVKSDVVLSSMSGGTDMCNSLVGATPLVPVYEGELSCRWLGAAVAAFDEGGNEVIGERGELVVTEPMPSMPVRFWGDEDGSRYSAAYFDRFPGVWSHGDWITVTERHSVIISGRSDATLNRGGVRLGTSEIYAALERLGAIEDALVIHLEPTYGDVDELMLFVVLSDGRQLDEELILVIRRTLRDQLSPRHVPDVIVQMPSVPKTLSGKKLEIPVKRVLGGATVDEVVNTETLSDPDSITAYARYATEHRQSKR